MLQKLISGDSLNFATAVPMYPATAGWVLKYRLSPRKSTNTAIDITATAAGAGYRVQVAASTTAAWAPDNYGWGSWVELGSETYTVATGMIKITPNPRTMAAGFDDRSIEEQQLEQVIATIQARITGGMVAEYSIGSRSLKNEPMTALLTLRSTLRYTVSRQRRAQQLANGLGRPDRLGVRFN